MQATATSTVDLSVWSGFEQEFVESLSKKGESSVVMETCDAVSVWDGDDESLKQENSCSDWLKIFEAVHSCF